MRCQRVSLSSGESFYVDAPAVELARALEGSGLVAIGGRIVNPLQVAQIFEDEVPSIFTPEKLEQEVKE